MDKISVFNFKDYKDFLATISKDVTTLNGRQMTLAEWAKKLGYRSPSSMAMVLNGQRLPSAQMLNQLGQALTMSASERSYLALLVQLELKKRKDQDTEEVLKELNRLSGKRKAYLLDLNKFSFISSWYCAVIKQLVGTVSFKEDLHWISRRLGRKVTPSQIKEALKGLMSLGLVIRNEHGHLAVAKKQIEAGGNIPSQALRQHHRGMILRALDALEGKKTEERDFRGLTMRMDPKKYTEMTGKIKKFVEELSTEYEDNNSEHIYQFNCQLYEHTEIKRKS